MAVQPGYLEYVLEQLASLPSLRPNRMFGGIGLYSDGVFFGLIDDDTLFFKTGESNIAPYRDRNMPRFMPFPDRPDAVLGYHQVPADVIEEAETLVEWARRSLEVALAARTAKAKSGRAPKPKPKPKRKRKPKRESKSTPPPRKPARSGSNPTHSSVRTRSGVKRSGTKRSGAKRSRAKRRASAPTKPRR
jgi:DNA transformation protein